MILLDQTNPRPERPLLEVTDLRLELDGPQGTIHALNGVTFQAFAQERIGLVGESGSGKSLTAQAILGLVAGARISGEARFDGEDLLHMAPAALRAIRGREIGYVFQDPLAALDPVRTVGDQIAEVLRIRGVGRRIARERAIDMLGRVGITDARRRIDDYPHQFSGGMRQRVMIASALVAEPRLLIADEPTTALDVRVQAQVVELLHELADEQQLAVIFITHDLGVLAGFADRVIVMYAGRSVEQCAVDDLYDRPLHPYAEGLLAALPSIDGPIPEMLPTIGGRPPAPTDLPPGCPFHPRCPLAIEVCREVVPPLREVVPGHLSACHRAEVLLGEPPLRSAQEGTA